MKYSWLAILLLALGLIGGFAFYKGYSDSKAGVIENAEIVEAGSSIEAFRRSVDPMFMRKGVQLMQTHCNNCHGVKGKTHDQLLAPPLWGVRMNYMKKYPEAEAFIESMSDFLTEPKHGDSLMPQAVDRFGLMPMLPLPDEILRPILSALYAGAVERPDWANGGMHNH
jgi:cytochrome c553